MELLIQLTCDFENQLLLTNLTSQASIKETTSKRWNPDSGPNISQVSFIQTTQLMREKS